MRDANLTGRVDSTNWNHSNQGGAYPSDKDRREIPEPQTTYSNDQTAHSPDATAMIIALEHLNKSSQTCLTRLSRTNERSEKSRWVFKKPRCYKDEPEFCIDTWIVMKIPGGHEVAF